MARVPHIPHPAGSSYDRDRRGVNAEIERLDRKRYEPQPELPLVRLDLEKAAWWRPGTAWLDQTVPAP